MPLSDDDFAARSAAFKKRAEALSLATKQEDRIKSFVNAGTMTLTALVLSLYFGGSWMGTKGLVAGLVGVFVARWIANLIVALTWRYPLMKRIDAEAPAPPPRT